MLKMKGATRILSHVYKRGLTVFSPKITSHNTNLIFPLYSRVVNECGIILDNHPKKGARFSVVDSLIPFYGLSNKYLLHSKSILRGDIGMTAAANLAASIHVNFLKLITLTCLKTAMEIFSQWFSVQEYYALSEFIAVSLIEAGKTEQAIQLIKNLPSMASKIYNSSFASIDPLFRSLQELLTLAYLVHGDYLQAENEARKLISTFEKKPLHNDLARAYTVGAIACCLQEKLEDSILFQENAVKLLQKNHMNALYATSLFNLNALYTISNKQEQAKIALQNLTSVLEETQDPRMMKFKAFLADFINTPKEVSPYPTLR